MSPTNTMVTKRKLFTLALIAVGAWIFLSWFKPVSPESRFKTLFSDLSVGVPEYQEFRAFSQPEDAIKGDVFSAEIIQSDSQFRKFSTRLGVLPDGILSSTSPWIRTGSEMNPEYPWMLQVRAHVGSAPKTCEVHIDGQQPYD